jgi:spore coat protein H
MESAVAELKTRFDDRRFLEGWRRDPAPELFRTVITEYGPLVYSSSLRQTADAGRALEIARAVFLALANRARKLSKGTHLADWLFQTTALAVKKASTKSRWRWLRFERKRKWIMDSAILHLRKRQRRAVLSHVFLNRPAGEKALKRALRKLERRGVQLEAPQPIPSELLEEIVAALPANLQRKPADTLTRRIVKTLRWRVRRRRIYFALLAWHTALACAISIFLYRDAKIGFSRTIATWILVDVRVFAWLTRDGPAKAWPQDPATPTLSASAIGKAADLYKMTNIWQANFSFSREHWKALQPRGIEPLANFVTPDGRIHLRNPAAPRSGLAGAMGYAYDWTRADFEFGGIEFPETAVRLKSNAGALAGGAKKPFKVDLNKYGKGRKLAGLDELTFANVMWDRTYLSDALGYELFRDAGVPAPRTAFAWVSLSIEKKFDHKPMGLYLMVEPVDSAFAKERFGSRQTPIFKPVTYELFKYLGPDWKAYTDIYDLKTKATAEQRQRLVDFCRLITSAPEAEFAGELPKFLDMDEFARFIAGQVLMASYDGIFTTGQNFYMYLDPRSNKFGFIPWDLDSAWGNFWIAKPPLLRRANIWRPWVGENQFLDRVMSLEEFRIIYRQSLDEMLEGLFVKERLERRVNELATVLREPIAAESKLRAKLFEETIGFQPATHADGILLRLMDLPSNPLLPFIEARARSVRQQLDGKSQGFLIKPMAER